VTHEAAVIRDIAEHAVCLRDGRVVAEGHPADVIA
jgi:ABC-type methionine transport system ATPase subunit